MTGLGDAAVRYAEAGWEIFPLAPRSKLPALPHAHRCRGHVGPPLCCSNPLHEAQHAGCRGACGVDGHGVLDATTDLAKVTAWWSAEPRRNIGGRVPPGVLVLDVDPRHGGLDGLARIQLEHLEQLPATRTAVSGRGDGGVHLYWQHPGGDATGARLGPGIDLKSRGGYLVLPPSIHPDTGRPYTWVDPSVPIAAPPAWLAELLRPAPPAVTLTCLEALSERGPFDGDSIADWFTATRSWHDVLGPHGWHVVAGDGDRDGSAWRHPTATAKQSATVRHECLFVYSTTPGLPVTAAGDRHGLTRFRAWALLDHAGDLSAAGAAARQIRNVEDVFWVSAS